MSGEGPAYVPRDPLEEDVLEEQYEATEAAQAVEGQQEQQIPPEVIPEAGSQRARPNA